MDNQKHDWTASKRSWTPDGGSSRPSSVAAEQEVTALATCLKPEKFSRFPFVELAHNQQKLR
ncbi:hypothetical protein TYRP_010121 [Tyrophagus putrescentiae]|nr:hypothetical protein TYRP_010121 [Tyrophagus putrescentiae]